MIELQIFDSLHLIFFFLEKLISIKCITGIKILDPKIKSPTSHWPYPPKRFKLSRRLRLETLGFLPPVRYLLSVVNQFLAGQYGSLLRLKLGFPWLSKINWDACKQARTPELRSKHPAHQPLAKGLRALSSRYACVLKYYITKGKRYTFGGEKFNSKLPDSKFLCCWLSLS